MVGIIFSVLTPLIKIEDNYKYNIFDSHVHIWGHRYVNEYLEYKKKFGVERILAIGGRDLKEKLESNGISNNIVLCESLSSYNFLKFRFKNSETRLIRLIQMILIF